MSVVSDNIANASTTGFKSGAAHFGDMVNTYLSLQSTNAVQSEGAGSTVLGIATNFAQGNLQSAANWSDLAVSGRGFFIVKQPDSTGSTGTSLAHYTRDGSFHLDADGYLVNSMGYRAQGYTAPNVPNPPGNLGDLRVATPENYASINVSNDGTITATDTSGVRTTIGTIELAGFSYEGGLNRQGGNLYTAGPDITDANTFYRAEDPLIFGKINDYSLEGSNVDMAAEMVNMIIYQASYNANSKSITTSRDMLDTSINLVR
jgi:flagellar hook protein FlgE